MSSMVKDPQVSSVIEDTLFQLNIQWIWNIDGKSDVKKAKCHVFCQGFPVESFIEKRLLQKSDLLEWYQQDSLEGREQTDYLAAFRSRVTSGVHCTQIAEFRLNQDVQANHSFRFDIEFCDYVFFIFIMEDNVEEVQKIIYCGTPSGDIPFSISERTDGDETMPKSFWAKFLRNRNVPKRNEKKYMLELKNNENRKNAKVLIVTDKNGLSTYSAIPRDKGLLTVSKELYDLWTKKKSSVRIVNLASLINSQEMN